MNVRTAYGMVRIEARSSRELATNFDTAISDLSKVLQGLTIMQTFHLLEVKQVASGLHAAGGQPMGEQILVLMVLYCYPEHY